MRQAHTRSGGGACLSSEFISFYVSRCTTRLSDQSHLCTSMSKGELQQSADTLRQDERNTERHEQEEWRTRCLGR